MERESRKNKIKCLKKKDRRVQLLHIGTDKMRDVGSPATSKQMDRYRPNLIEGNMSAKECKELHLCVDRKPSSMSSETNNVLLRLFKYRFYRNNLKFIPLVKKK